VVAVNLADVLYRRGELERARFYIGRVNSVQEYSNAQTLWLAARIENKMGNVRGARDLGRHCARASRRRPRRRRSSEAATMTEPAAPPADRSAGAMLRAARERQGLHIAALSAAIKVPQSKLEALEAGRYDELTDATFVRALAHSVCRVLKIDPKPVLDQLPIAHSTLLERAEHDLRAPFRERGAHETSESRLWHQPVFWLVVLLLVAAAAFVLWPSRANCP
jgi:cytoskeleton protein RodZ